MSSNTLTAKLTIFASYCSAKSIYRCDDVLSPLPNYIFKFLVHDQSPRGLTNSYLLTTRANPTEGFAESHPLLDGDPPSFVAALLARSTTKRFCKTISTSDARHFAE
jgi:hypothetical protein